MLSKADNERITRVGRGTPGGELLRRYWLPAVLSKELPERDGEPVEVRLLGEDLIAFRDTNGKVGLIDAYCPHRLAPMFYGRNEECGLRCVYHGWKFDVNGKCTEVPNEPADSPMKDKVRMLSYPTYEGGGIVWAYMGPADKKPPVPDYEWIRVPDTHRHVSKTFEACNYLQALEGGLDTSHSSFLHNNKLGDNSQLRQRDRAPRLVQTLIIESLENSGKIVAVGRESVGLRADYILKTELRDFEADATKGGTPVIGVRINAKLVRMPDRTIVASENFEARIPAEGGGIERHKRGQRCPSRSTVSRTAIR